jgi:hypothetical protein
LNPVSIYDREELTRRKSQLDGRLATAARTPHPKLAKLAGCRLAYAVHAHPRMRSRRDFFSVVGGVALVSLAGCVESPDATVGPDGAVEVLPRTPNLWYGNVMPAFAPVVRQSPALAANWSVTKQ